MSADLNINVNVNAAAAVTAIDSVRDATAKLRAEEKARRDNLNGLEGVFAGIARAVEEGHKRELRSAQEAFAGIGAAIQRLQHEQERAADISRRGMFGSEFAERLRHVSEGFRIAGTAAHDMSTRVQAGVGAAGMLAQGVMGLGRQIFDFAHGVAESQARLEDHDSRVRRLGMAYTEMRAQTAGVISSEQALAVQQAALNSDLHLSAENMGRVARAAREHASLYGGDVVQSTQAFTQAIQNADANALGRFGVTLDSTQGRARQLDSVLRQLAANQANNPPMPPSSTEALREFDAQVERGRAGVTRWILEALSPGRNAMREMREHTAQSADALRQHAEAAAQARVAQARLNVELERGAEQFRTMQAGPSEFNDPVTRTRASMEQEGIQSLASQAQANAQRRRSQARMVRAVRGMHLEGVTAADIPGASSGGGSNPLAGLNASIARVFAAQARITPFTGPSGPGADTSRFPGEPAAAYATRIANLAQTLEDSAGQYEQQSQSYWQRVASNRQFSEQHAGAISGAQRELASANSAAAENRGLMGRVDRLGAVEQGDLDAQIRNGARLTDETVRNAERMGDAAYQMGNAFTDVFGRSQTLAQGTAGLFRTAMGSMTQSFRSHIAALVTGRESIGDALRGMLHETLLALTQEAAVRAIMESAHGIAALATFRYPQAAAHFAAAGVYAGVAVAAGVGAAVTAPPQAPSMPASGGSDAGTRLGSSRASNDNAAGGGNQTFVINVNSALATREDVQDAVRMAQDHGASRSSVPIVQRQIENLRAA